MNHPASLHDILVAWRSGELSYRRALDLSGIDTLDELYDAAALSGVAMRETMSAEEDRAATLVADLIRDQVKLRAA
jgi:hypothetical protein